MLKLNRLHLKNFQAHKDLVLDFSDSVNVLYGDTDKGKSCVRRSIEFLCGFVNYNNSFRREGTKKTSVKGWFSNGVVLERIKSSSINRYVFEKDGETKQFDSVGRNMPEEIQEELGIFPIDIDKESIYINSSPQIALPFLLDKSATDRNKIFNKLTGNDVLDKTFSQFNKDILSFGRKIKSSNEQLEEFKNDLSEYEEKFEKQEKKLNSVEKDFKELKSNKEELDKLLEIKELSEKTDSGLKKCKNELKGLKIAEVVGLEELADKIKGLEELGKLHNDVLRNEKEISNTDGQLKRVRVPDIGFTEVTDHIKEVSELQLLEKEILENNKKLSVVKKKLSDINLDVLEKEYKDLLKEMKTCPTCGQKTG